MSHSGRPLVRTTSHSVVVLCPMGHVLQSVRNEDWAHSWIEAHCNDPAYEVTCGGTEPSP